MRSRLFPANSASDCLRFAKFHWCIHFEQLYNSNADTSMKDDLYNRIRVDCASNNGFVITVRDVMVAVCKLKDGKATGPDGISSEAIKYACPRLSVHLCLLFNLFLKHGYLPERFMQSIFVPLLNKKLS